ncbi:unnamed protein product [Symbiodinium sp. KB8]|nr:unnamed protein product [Symbiodinium sp. KB8]
MGWANQFRARESVFGLASKCSARGVKDQCIRHANKEGAADDILIDLWFDSFKDYHKFDAGLYERKDLFGKDSMKLQCQESLLPESQTQPVLASDYSSNPDSPLQYAQSGCIAGATAASGLRMKLEHQRIDKTAVKTYENMHIIPAALLQDDRKLSCRWLFLSGSAEFHKWFDGPDTAPHITVTIDKETASVFEGMTDFTLKVDTSKVELDAAILQPDGASKLPAGIGYATLVRIPSSQADNFRLALEWRAECCAEAWKRAKSDQKVNINDAAGAGWWRCVDLKDDLKSAIEAAKVSLEEGGADEI